MADPFNVRRYPVDRLSDAELRDVLLVLLSDPRYGRLARKVSAPATGFRGSGTSWGDVGGMLSKVLPGLQGPMDIGLADTVLKGKSRQELEDLAEVGFFEEAGRIPPGMRNPLPDILNAAKVAEETATKFQTQAARIAQAMDVGGTAGTLRARSGQLTSPTMTPRGSLPAAPVSPEGTSQESGATTEGGLNLAEELTKGLVGFKPEPKEPFVGTDPIEAYQDLLRRQAGISDQLDMLLDDPKGNQFKIEKLMAEATSVDNRIKTILPYVFQKGEAAERMALSREELEFRREQERNVGARHAASLGESAASRAQQAAQFAERQAFEREQERANLLKFQEGLEQQIQQLMVQAAQYSLPEGTPPIQGLYGPINVPTTQVNLRTQAPNLQAALAAAGA